MTNTGQSISTGQQQKYRQNLKYDDFYSNMWNLTICICSIFTRLIICTWNENGAAIIMCVIGLNMVGHIFSCYQSSSCSIYMFMFLSSNVSAYFIQSYKRVYDALWNNSFRLHMLSEKMWSLGTAIKMVWYICICYGHTFILSVIQNSSFF